MTNVVIYRKPGQSSTYPSPSSYYHSKLKHVYKGFSINHCAETKDIFVGMVFRIKFEHMFTLVK